MAGGGAGRRRLSDAAARGTLRRVYEAGYRYPSGFRGFAASVYYAWDREDWTGSVEVRSPSDIRYDGTIENADGQLHWEISVLASQCWAMDYEGAECGARLSLEARDEPLNWLLQVEDGLESAYRIQSGHVSQIERRFGDLRFSINIQERSFTDDGRALPAHYCVVYWSVEQARLVRTDIYRDGYLPVSSVYLPLGRRITTADDSGTTTRQILFRDHRLL